MHYVQPWFLRAAAKDRRIYARYASVASFLFLLRRFPSLAEYMGEITVVADGFKEHEYRSEWAWEDIAHKEGTALTSEDNKILDKIDFDHANEVIKANAFIYSGGYRTMLGDLFSLLLSTHTLTVRKLKVSLPNLKILCTRTDMSATLKADEHILGWSDTEKIKQLSFYRPGLDTKEVYYGDWQYDTVHHRVSIYTDEYGEDVVEPGAGPQASFIDDFNAALTTSGFAGQVIM
jgi:hypothetical protein